MALSIMQLPVITWPQKLPVITWPQKDMAATHNVAATHNGNCRHWIGHRKMPKRVVLASSERNIWKSKKFLDLVDAINQTVEDVAATNKEIHEFYLSLHEPYEEDPPKSLEYDIATAVHDYLKRTIKEDIYRPVLQHVVVCRETGNAVCKPDAVIYLGGKVVAVIAAKFNVTKQDIEELIESAEKMKVEDRLSGTLMFIGGPCFDENNKKFALKQNVGVVEISEEGYKVITTGEAL